MAIMVSACAPMNQVPTIANEKINISILAFNDLHGNLEPPIISVREKINGELKDVPAGGLAYLAAAIQHYKKRNPLHAVVSAGDMIGATPLISALFLDEPTIEAVNAIGIDFNAVGNHEFDKGTAELQRMRNGGCEKHTRTEPCQINRNFPGANFEFWQPTSNNPIKPPCFPLSVSKPSDKVNMKSKLALLV